ncbi:MAG TPA: N-acetylglucosamine-6-phosphate deacetylase, partial [Planctomycetota bacterium]|nr:N-acetylglucosamine-6-phosphate deacetylase [Planctomycetota bacterium]
MRIAGLFAAHHKPMTLDIQAGKIAAIEPGVVRADLGDDEHYIAAGMIDAQHNGYLGLGFPDLKCTVDNIKTIIDANWKTGTTHFYPTIYTNTDEVYTHALRTIAAAAEDPKYGRAILGVHVEGPYLSPVDGPRGSHLLKYIREPNLAEFKKWHDVSGKRIKLVTVAPEINGALDFIRAAKRMKIKVALGHHNATAEQIQAAIEAGADMVTHLGNGAHRMVNRFHN